MSDADTQGKPEQEATLQEALSEFDKAKETPAETQPAETPKQDVDLGEVVKTSREMRAYLDGEKSKAIEADLDGAAEKILGETGESKGLVRGWMEYQAAQDPRISEAFLRRHENPAAFTKVVNSLKAEFAKSRETKVDQAATEERAAVNSAVKASANAPPSEEMSDDKIWNMDPGDWAKFKRSHGVF